MVSHLLFVDDLLIFTRAKRQDSFAINTCLDKYMGWSGQKINRDKSSVHFNSNLHGRAMLSIMDILGLKKLQPKPSTWVFLY